jgi:hypothetical protein
MDVVCVRVNAPQVIFEAIDGEVIIIDLGTGTYFAAKGAAAEVWGLLVSAPVVSVEGLVDVLAPVYGVPRAEVEAGVSEFVEELLGEGLVVAVEGGVGAVVSGPVAGGAGPFVPRLEKYTDMQDLVLIDPVHQVDAAGWPPAAPEGAGAREANA